MFNKWFILVILTAISETMFLDVRRFLMWKNLFKRFFLHWATRSMGRMAI